VRLGNYRQRADCVFGVLKQANASAGAVVQFRSIVGCGGTERGNNCWAVEGCWGC
jgi:hypothetical protein